MNLVKLLIPPTYAQTDPIGQLEAPASIVTQPENIYKIFNSVVNLLIVVAGIWFLVQIILAGFNYITGAGDSNKTGEAMKKITDSVIGLVIVAAAFIITYIAGALFFGTSFNILQPTIKTITDF
jgi:uncharacterized membrane protein